MSKVRVLVGTRKGAFILTSDGKRKDWEVSGPHFAGWEIYHLKGSPADPNRLYASQTSGWFGQVIQRSNDGGKTWETPGGGMAATPDGMPSGESNKFVYDSCAENGKPLTTTSGMTARNIRGNSSEYGISSHRSPTLIPSMQELRTQRCSDRLTVARPGTNFQDCAATVLALAGSQVLAECACTRYFWIRTIRTESSSRFRRRAHFVPTTPGKPGNRSIRD